MTKAIIKSLLSKLLNTPLVVEQGTSGIWNYRKWSNGIAEVWGNLNTTVTIAGSNPLSSGGYYMLNQAYPFSFLSAPSVSVNGALGSGYCITGRDYRQTNTMQVLLYSSAAGSVGAELGFYAIGKWK